MATAYIIERQGAGWTILNILLIFLILYAAFYLANRYSPFPIFESNVAKAAAASRASNGNGGY